MSSRTLVVAVARVNLCIGMLLNAIKAEYQFVCVNTASVIDDVPAQSKINRVYLLK